MKDESPPHQANERLRKSLHIAFGLFAFGLKWLPWWVATGVAAVAVLGNWLVLHKIVGRAVARHERGWDAGIVLYPLSVLALILLFRNNLHIAGVAWGVLAFGDGFATIIGKRFGGPRLPWNSGKTWAGFLGFIAAGYLPVLVLSYHLSNEPTWLARWLIVLAAVAAGAIAESLPLGVDDNITVPAAAAVAVWILQSPFEPRFELSSATAAFLILNTILAVAGYLVRSVDLSGMIGGWVLGAILIVVWPTLYYVLIAFFVLGTLATKAGYRRKAEAGLAQEQGGRRGFSHAFANVGVAALCAVGLAFHDQVTAFWWAAAAALATAAADTVASEIGQLMGKRAFMPLTFRRVPRGTEGAISIEGTVAGLAAAVIVSIVALLALNLTQRPFWEMMLPPVLMITGCAMAGSYVESIVGTWNRTRSLGISNGALNFFNTAVGATLAFVIAPLLKDRGMI